MNKSALVRSLGIRWSLTAYDLIQFGVVVVVLVVVVLLAFRWPMTCARSLPDRKEGKKSKYLRKLHACLIEDLIVLLAHTHTHTLIRYWAPLVCSRWRQRVFVCQTNWIDSGYTEELLSATLHSAHTHTAAFLLIVATERRVCLCVCRWTSFNGFCHEVQVDW